MRAEESPAPAEQSSAADPSDVEPSGAATPPEGSNPSDESGASPVGETSSWEQEREELKDRLLRSAAELENLRKRSRREIAEARDRGIGDLASGLFDVLDNFERALAAAAEDDPLATGVRMVHQQLLDRLGQFGIVRVEPLGQSFDPHWHEAIAEVTRDDLESGTVLDVLCAGYRQGERLLRAASVRVSARSTSGTDAVDDSVEEC